MVVYKSRSRPFNRFNVPNFIPFVFRFVRLLVRYEDRNGRTSVTNVKKCVG